MNLVDCTWCWYLRLCARLDWAFVASAFNLHVSFLFLFMRLGVMRLLFMYCSLNSSRKCWIFCSKQCICVLFMDPQIPLFSNFFIKNGFHDTIHTFKNYFATVFSVFNFQFQQIKFYPNRPYVCMQVYKCSLLYILTCAHKQISIPIIIVNDQWYLTLLNNKIKQSWCRYHLISIKQKLKRKKNP